MHYIVFDLEWNQCPEGKEKEEKGLPFEIIEIGAVKLDENFQLADIFHTMVKPQVYLWIHEKTREVVHLDYKNLLNGLLFPRAAMEFLKWAGENARFCTWGDIDLLELQRNMKYYHILGLLPGPVIYYDVQKLFSIQRKERGQRRSLQYAMEEMKLDCKMSLHRALVDAWYTAEIVKRLKEEVIPENSSIDVYQNPKGKKDEITISYGDRTRFISREFPTKERAMREKGILTVRCPRCEKTAKRKTGWFAVNTKRYLSIYCCQEHGYLKGKIRIKSTDEKKYYLMKTVELTDKKEVKRVQEKQEALRMKRRKKKSEK